jgi:16S rRNA (uracil1498-N3)-methyltransferase
MSMSEKILRRIFHAEIDGESALLVPEEAHHVSRVLRLRAGDRLEVFDGLGGSRPARVGEVDRRDVEVVFSGPKVVHERPAPAITLAVAPPKGQRMDTLVQMVQEIGIDELVPIVTDNSMRQEFNENRYARWRRVTVAAAKQSGTNFLLSVGQTADFDEILAGLDQWDLRLVCHNEYGYESLRESLMKQQRPERILIAIGPEGGFSSMELKSARESGCATVRLAAPMLRVETAAVFAVSALCHHFDRGPTLPQDIKNASAGPS